ncbi:MAG: hypothetical protein LBJ67_19060 [Planctomycetaceae bacterium]|jgi:uncharacterized membrane protein YphA (DoxX/SURF4 family)|nr:hypothetical protein [Planctomycetaceae bacterium]
MQSSIHQSYNQFWNILRLLVGCIILIAAGLKAEALAAGTPDLGSGLLHARWFNIIVVECELVFGIWLLSGLLQKLAWLISLFLFVGFLVILFYEMVILHETTNCGCFGRHVKIPPIYTAIFDTMVIGLLIVFHPKGIVFRWQMFFHEVVGLRFSKRLFAVIGIWLIVAVPVTYAMFSVQKNEIAELGTEFVGINGKKTISLQPEKWTGKEFSLLAYITPTNHEKQLTQGKWMLLFYHENCRVCDKAIDEYEILARNVQHENIDIKFALVGIPPLSKNKRDLPESDNGLFFYFLNEENYWNIKTPVQITLKDGIVENIDYF